jgi:hypothetical protein
LFEINSKWCTFSNSNETQLTHSVPSTWRYRLQTAADPRSGHPKKKKKKKKVVPLPCDKGTASNNGDLLVNSPGTDNAALHVLFNVIVVFLEQSSNLWFTPTEIATSLQEEGLSEHLHGFHVRLAINKCSRLGINATHELQLSGGDQLTYFRLSSVSDADTPRKQRESDSFCLPPKCNLKPESVGGARTS